MKFGITILNDVCLSPKDAKMNRLDGSFFLIFLVSWLVNFCIHRGTFNASKTAGSTRFL